MSTLTIFTAPKPFTNPHIALIQRNAIRSWKALGKDVEVFLVGDEEGIGEAAVSLSVGHIPEVRRSLSGVPLISSIFAETRARSRAPLLAYVNADVLLLPDFLEVARAVAARQKTFLLVGQRWNLDVREELEFEPGWVERMRERIARQGFLHLPMGSDYFIFPQACFRDIPDFSVGRAGWDNWMLFHARWMRWPLIDATGAINVVHQQHDYSHLPGGQPHYRHPESYENIRLAGGKWAIFTLIDADHVLCAGQVQKSPLNRQKLWRELQTFPVRLRSRWLGRLFYIVFHPVKAYREFRRQQGSRAQASGG